MRYSELVAYTKEASPIKSDLLIIISSYNGYALVFKHLALLSRQTYQKFNVLLVLGVPFEDDRLLAHLKKKKYRFGTIIAKENERRGCSGAFFTGQKYALKQGYSFVIMADDDCMPVDRNLIQELYKNRKAGYVAPTTVFVEGSYRKRGFRAGPTQYSLYSSDIFKKYGLYYLPLFHGADDGEYMERVKQKPLHIPQKTEHPYISGMRLFAMFDRQWLFMLQALMILREFRTNIYNLSQFCFMTSVSAVFMPSYGRKSALNADSLLLRYNYGKEAGETMRTGFEAWISKRLPSSFEGWQKITESDANYIDLSTVEKIASLVASQIQFFRKDVVIEMTHSFIRAFFLGVVSRRLYVRMPDGSYLEFADNSNPVLHFARLAFFPIVIALQTAVCAAFFALKTIRQPDTQFYGL